MPEILSILRYRIVKRLMGLKLSQGQAEAIGRCLGTIAWAVDPLHRRVADTQLKAALGINSPGSLRLMRMQGELILDTLRFINQDDRQALAELKVHGREHLEKARAQARAEGRGIMILTGHVGPWEIMSWLSKALDFEFCVMADQRDDKRLEDLIQRIHTAGGVKILPPRGGMLKYLIGELKAGRSIAFMPDQRGNRSSGLLSDFFGMPAPTNPAPAYIALLGDAIIVPCFALKRGHELSLNLAPALDSRAFPQDLGPEVRFRDAAQTAGVQALSDAMQGLIEDVVAQHPLQWFWVHCRWTRRANMKKLARRGLDFKTYVKQQAADIRAGGFGLPGGRPC